jgi:uncharacterized membrane protein YidH (DUF202 family)
MLCCVGINIAAIAMFSYQITKHMFRRHKKNTALKDVAVKQKRKAFRVIQGGK